MTEDLRNGDGTPATLVERLWQAIFSVLSIEEIAVLSEMRKDDAMRPVFRALTKLATEIERRVAELPPPEQPTSEAGESLAELSGDDASGLMRTLARTH